MTTVTSQHLRIYEISTQVWVCILIIILSCDSLNPIKTLSSFISIKPIFFTISSFLTLLGILIYNASNTIYFCIRIFFYSVLSTFFKSIDIIGADNIPSNGPVIFTGNHANQFVDGIMVMVNCRRKVGFIIAEKSWNRPLIGHFAKLVGCIPVRRAQDSIVQGTGQVSMIFENENGANDNVKYKLIGKNTLFSTELRPGDQIYYKGKAVIDSGEPVRVVEVVNNTELYIEAPLLDNEKKCIDESVYVSFVILKKVDHSVMFNDVYEHLEKGNSIGIFPEGGSHDRTDLLPLKIGVAIIALGVKEKYNIRVPVVPVGLTYYRGHRFRGRATIEFGTPIYPDAEIMSLYATNKKEARCQLLHRVEEGMRSVIVTTADYGTLQLVYCARRLYEPTGMRLSPAKRQDYNRRFSEGYKSLASRPECQEDLKSLASKLQAYERVLRRFGLKDYQVPYLPWWSFHDLLSSGIYSLIIFALASIPSFILNFPVGIVARYVARAEQKRALAGSKVKIRGHDVMMSKRIAFSILAIPILWLTYMIAAIVLTDWYVSSVMMLFACFPLFSYFGVIAVEAGVIEMKAIQPFVYRLSPSCREIQDQLPKQRIQLQILVRDFIEKYKDILGPLAKDEPIDWKEYMRKLGSQSHILSPSSPSISTAPEQQVSSEK